MGAEEGIGAHQPAPGHGTPGLMGISDSPTRFGQRCDKNSEKVAEKAGADAPKPGGCPVRASVCRTPASPLGEQPRGFGANGEPDGIEGEENRAKKGFKEGEPASQIIIALTRSLARGHARPTPVSKDWHGSDVRSMQRPAAVRASLQAWTTPFLPGHSSAAGRAPCVRWPAAALPAASPGYAGVLPERGRCV